MATKNDVLDRIADICVADILEMSDAEIMAEAVEQHGSEAAASAYASFLKQRLFAAELSTRTGCADEEGASIG